MQTAHTAAPPAAPFPLITMCCGGLASWGGCLLRKQARADATGGISKSQAFRLWGQRDSSIGNASKTDQRSEVSHKSTSALGAGGAVLPFPPSSGSNFGWLVRSTASWVICLELSYSTDSCTDHFHCLEPPTHVLLHAANADHTSPQCKWNGSWLPFSGGSGYVHGHFPKTAAVL